MYTSLVGADETRIGVMRWGPFCVCNNLKVKIAGGGGTGNAGTSKFIMVKEVHDDSELMRMTLWTALGGNNYETMDGLTLTIDTSSINGKEVYLEFEDVDANDHGKGFAWIAFDPNVVVSCSG